MNNRVFENVPLAKLCTYRIGGIAKKVVRVFDAEGLRRVMSEEGDKIVIGRGSKILFCDEGFDGVVVIMSGERMEFWNGGRCETKNSRGSRGRPPIGDLVSEQKINSLFSAYYMYADSGVFLPAIAIECAKRNLSGLEWATGIPGSVGGAVWMNAGAHGGDIASVCEWVKVYRDGQIVRVHNKDCGFGYRSSGFKQGDIILGACLRLQNGDRDEIEKRMKGYAEARKKAQPKGFSCGSVFKSVVSKGRTIPAWELIDACGLKGIRIGSAVISEKHANFILNIGGDGTKAEDVKTLIRLIKTKVYKKFGIMLEEEVVYAGTTI